MNKAVLIKCAKPDAVLFLVGHGTRFVHAYGYIYVTDTGQPEVFRRWAAGEDAPQCLLDNIDPEPFKYVSVQDF